MTEDDGPLNREDAILLALETIGHADRLRVLLACSAAPSSPKQMSTQRQAIGQTAYHVRLLVDKSLIRQTRTRQVRGATETFYTATAAGRKLLAKLGLEEGRAEPS